MNFEQKLELERSNTLLNYPNHPWKLHGNFIERRNLLDIRTLSRVQLLMSADRATSLILNETWCPIIERTTLYSRLILPIHETSRVITLQKSKIRQINAIINFYPAKFVNVAERNVWNITYHRYSNLKLNDCIMIYIFSKIYMSLDREYMRKIRRKFHWGEKCSESVHDSTMHVVSVVFVNRSRGV